MTMKTRDSNMELLRIVAMLLIMTVHASYRALPHPTPASIEADALSGFLQLLTQSFSVVGVNVFVMLSGWYAIRPRLVRFSELVFQLLFFGVLCLGIEYCVSGQLPPKAITTLFMLNDGNYWFIKVYIALYILAPVLNTFAESATRRQLATVLLCFFGFQWVFGWVFEATAWLRAGYSLPSFMGLYLLARYMSIYRPAWTRLSSKADLLVYTAVCLMVAIASFLLKWHLNLGGVLFFYNSPTVIVAATFLLLFFSKLHISSRLINWVAASALAIYLTHSSSFLAKYYDGTIQAWHGQLSRPAFLLSVVLLIAAVFVGSILLDKLRLLLLQQLQRFIRNP